MKRVEIADDFYMTTIGVTGAAGFIGSHLVEFLRRNKENVIALDKEEFDDTTKLQTLLLQCDVIVHLAGVNRGTPEEVYTGNVALANQLVQTLETIRKTPFLIFSSSTQIDLENEYGRSKRDAAKILAQWAKKNGARFLTLVISNVYGDRCKPFYNSVVATFCYQLLHNQEPQIKEDREIELIHVNNLTNVFYKAINDNKNKEVNYDSGCEIRVPCDKKISVSLLLSLLQRFKALREKGIIPDLFDPFERNLYTVFDSYADGKLREYHPVIRADPRGELFETIKFEKAGQLFFSTTKPGHIRGEHYHSRKLEKFFVLKGDAIIRMRNPDTAELIEYHITGPACIDIPVFWPHNIENVGTEELYTLFWAADIFDQEADTYPEKVKKD